MVKAFVEFLKTTLIGGLLIVVPVYLTVLLLGKVLKGMIALLGPIVALFPESLHHFAQIIAIALVVVVCFMLGLIARTGLGRRAIAAFEQHVLERMPGFAMVRSVVRRVSGSSDDAQFQPVLVETDEETLTPGFIVEELDDDRRRAGTVGAYTRRRFPLHPAAQARALGRRTSHRGDRRDHALGFRHEQAPQGDALRVRVERTSPREGQLSRGAGADPRAARRSDR
jgi:Protein of unknown function (DUF502)